MLEIASDLPGEGFHSSTAALLHVPMRKDVIPPRQGCGGPPASSSARFPRLNKVGDSVPGVLAILDKLTRFRHYAVSLSGLAHCEIPI